MDQESVCWICGKNTETLLKDPRLTEWLAREDERGGEALQTIPVGPPRLQVEVPVCLVCQCLAEALADEVVEAALRWGRPAPSESASAGTKARLAGFT